MAGKSKPYCEGCKKKLTVHLTEIIDGKMTEMHFCEDCPMLKTIQNEHQFGLADLLAGLADFGGPSPVKTEVKQEIKCTNCGMSYEEFRKTGRLGCSECYKSFKPHLSTLLKKIHGSLHYIGKAPAMISKPQKQKIENLQEFKSQLRDAIQAEDFEKAAILRDKIRELEKGQG